MRRALRSLVLASAGWTALCGSNLRAQVPPPAASPAEPSARPDALELKALRERYRPALHPGDPLKISGNEQGGNDLRAITPILARGEHEPQPVDIETSYRRALAMYGEGQQFHAPLPLAPGAESPAPAPLRHAAPQAPAESAPKVQRPEATPWSVLSGLFVSTLLIAWFLVRVRPALRAPKEAPIAAPQAEAEPFVWRPTRRPRAPFRLTNDDPPPALPRHLPGVARATHRPKQR